MRSLLRKEMRAQIPFAFLVAFLAVIDFVERLVSGFPDAKSLAGLMADSSEAGPFGFLCLMLAVALGLALLPRERDEGTLEFLDGLPCTRGQVFAAKAFTGIGILGLFPLLNNLMALTLHRLGRTSLDTPWPWAILGKMFAIEWTILIAFLGVGLALSYFRRFAFLMVGLLIAVFLVLDAIGVPHLALVDFTQVLNYTIRFGRLEVPWQSLMAFVAVGMTGYAVAFVVFQFQGDRAARIVALIRSTKTTSLP